MFFALAGHFSVSGRLDLVLLPIQGWVGVPGQVCDLGRKKLVAHPLGASLRRMRELGRGAGCVKCIPPGSIFGFAGGRGRSW